jgi:Flp pilus assembly protein TadD
VQYFNGEAYRQRGREGDTKLALEAYRAALEMDSTPPEVHRSLGTVLRQAGENAEATRAFQRYLELKPGAEDAELIRSYLTGSQS